jgi:hypothetical protein
MADRLSRLLLEIQGQAGKLEAQHELALFWMAEMRNGHPKAQDFEPTGHGGSDPTSQNGTRDDYAHRDGKLYVQAIERAWKAMDAAAAISRRYQNGIPLATGPIEDEFCVMHYKHEKTFLRYRGTLCRRCYERRGELAKQGLELTDADVEYDAKWGKWPRGQLIDPKSVHVARLERLALGTTALPVPGKEI